jgi:hypothetical protein
MGVIRKRMTITLPCQLSDGELIAAVMRCARDEKHATAVLVAHLAEFDARRLFLAAGYSSLFAYCCEVLGLSEDATCNRIEAARACRMFPAVLDRLADGSLTVTTVRLLARHLTAENHQELLAAASSRSRRAVEELVACHFPKPDTRSSIRKVPERVVSAASPPMPSRPEPTPAPVMAAPPPPKPTAFSLATRSEHRPRVKPLSPDRYEFRFTGSAAMRDKMRIAQDLERHAVPNGDIARIVERALDALIDLRARAKLAIVRKPQARPRPTASGSRHVPSTVKRAVWARDGGRCAFVAPVGHRCLEGTFLEYHHVTPYAVGGEATIANIQLRCRAHNGYEKELFYGARVGGANIVREAPAQSAVLSSRHPFRNG